jgi:formylglycine-generating enzyme required for sulfatase activity
MDEATPDTPCGSASGSGSPEHEMACIPGNVFRTGSDAHYPEKAPAHRGSVGGFWINTTPVTDAQFRRFVEESGHVSCAKSPPDRRQPRRRTCGLSSLNGHIGA